MITESIRQALERLALVIDRAGAPGEAPIYDDTRLIALYESSPNSVKLSELIASLRRRSSSRASPALCMACAHLCNVLESYRTTGDWLADVDLLIYTEQALDAELSSRTYDVRCEGDTIQAITQLCNEAEKSLLRLQSEWSDALQCMSDITTYGSRLAEKVKTNALTSTEYIRDAVDQLRWIPQLPLPSTSVAIELWHATTALVGRYHDCRLKVVHHLATSGVKIIAPVPGVSVFDTSIHEARGDYRIPTTPDLEGKVESVMQYGFVWSGAISKAHVIAWSSRPKASDSAPASKEVVW